MKERTQGKPIKGQLDPFRNYLDAYDNLATTDNGFNILRERLKDAIALRMQCVCSNSIKISEACIKIIKEYCKDEDEFSFVNCTLLYYDEKKEHKGELNTSCSSCRSKDKYKSARHALKDCLRCGKYYLGRVEKRNFVKSDEIRNCIISTRKAIEFVSNYIYKLLVDEIPKVLKESLFNKISKKDNSIQNLYSYNVEGGFYTVKAKTLYSSLKLETATELFCGYFFKS